jgi:pimeloyl-CoA synthetase
MKYYHICYNFRGFPCERIVKEYNKENALKLFLERGIFSWEFQNITIEEIENKN